MQHPFKTAAADLREIANETTDPDVRALLRGLAAPVVDGDAVRDTIDAMPYDDVLALLTIFGSRALQAASDGDPAMAATWAGVMGAVESHIRHRPEYATDAPPADA